MQTPVTDSKRAMVHLAAREVQPAGQFKPADLLRPAARLRPVARLVTRLQRVRDTTRVPGQIPVKARQPAVLPTRPVPAQRRVNRRQHALGQPRASVILRAVQIPATCSQHVRDLRPVRERTAAPVAQRVRACSPARGLLRAAVRPHAKVSTPVLARRRATEQRHAAAWLSLAPDSSHARDQ